jgi:hypothetical protein
MDVKFGFGIFLGAAKVFCAGSMCFKSVLLVVLHLLFKDRYIYIFLTRSQHEVLRIILLVKDYKISTFLFSKSDCLL